MEFFWGRKILIKETEFFGYGFKVFLKKFLLSIIYIVYLRYTYFGVNMSQNKSNLFHKNEIQMANFAKALAHPARIHILKILIKKNVCICGDIVEMMPLAQATVSQHLKELKRVGLIQGEIEGPKFCYCLNPETIKKAKKAFDALFNLLSKC